MKPLKTLVFALACLVLRIVRVALRDLSTTSTLDQPDSLPLFTTDVASKSYSYFLEQSQDKEPLVRILLEAGLEPRNETIQKLPKMQDVVNLYGDVLQLQQDQCQKFRAKVPAKLAVVAPAGLFNSGTNLLAEYLDQNCIMPDRVSAIPAMQREVPWGKHNWPLHRKTITTNPPINHRNVLPVVVVRDPYSWMNSICLNPDVLRWNHDKGHCPNLIPNDIDYKTFPSNTTSPIQVVSFASHYLFSDDNNNYKWDSLAHVWMDWYRRYMIDTEYPRIMVRFEDLIFRPRQIVRAVCECAGGEAKHPKFKYATAAKNNNNNYAKKFNVRRSSNSSSASAFNMVFAMIKYGSAASRTEGFTPEDLKYVAQVMDRDMMRTFGYNIISE